MTIGVGGSTAAGSAGKSLDRMAVDFFSKTAPRAERAPSTLKRRYSSVRLLSFRRSGSHPQRHGLDPGTRRTQRRLSERRSTRLIGSTSMRQNDLDGAPSTPMTAARMTAAWVTAIV
jgi:hypothetical protein